MIDGNMLAKAGFAYLGRSYDEMDCQAFIEQCLRDCGLKMDLAGSNAWYREVMKDGVVMSPEECVQKLGTVPRGAFLFIHAFDGGEEKRGYHDGLGNASHIGIVTGRGEGAIHSSSSRGGVCESKFQNKTIKNGGWNKVGLYGKIAYDYGDGFIPDVPDTPDILEPVNKIVFSENGNSVNMRKSPRLNAALVERVPIGDTVTWLKEDGSGWAYIEWKKKRGWMMDCYLIDEIVPDPIPEPDIPEPADPDPVPDDPAGETLTVWADNGLPVKLRKRPSTSCNIWERLPVGTEVELVEAGSEWCKVNYGTFKGWYMMTKFLSRG